MMKNILLATALCFCASQATAAEVTAALGATGQGDATARVGLGWNWDRSWLNTATGRLTGYWDLGYTYWQAGDEAGGRHSVSFAPVFVYEFGQGYVKPFLEAGIGVSLFSGATAGDQKLGSSFNFEDRIGGGVKFGDAQRVGLRVIHYSNAGLGEPNDGIESYSLFYSHTL